MAAPKSPLTLEHLEILDQILASTAETAEYCDQCCQCNINVDREKRANEEQAKIAAQIKAKFFPESP